MQHADVPLESLPLSSKYRYLLLALCATFALNGLLQIVNERPPIALLPLLPLIPCLIWSYSSHTIQIFADGIEVKKGPLAPVHYFTFDTLDSVETTKKAILLKLKRAKKGSDFKIQRLLLQPEDQDWLIEKLEYEMAAA